VVTASYLLFLVKRVAAPVRQALAAAIPDPGERRGLIVRTPVRDKLLLCVLGGAIIPVLFAVLISRQKTEDSVEAFALQRGHEVLAAIASRSSGYSRGALRARAIADARTFASTFEIGEVDLAAPGEFAARLGQPMVDAIRDAIAESSSGGDSTQLATDALFVWQQIEGERILLVEIPPSALRADAVETWTSFGLLLFFSTAVSLGLAWLLAGDVGRATSGLQREAERMASGDLRRGVAFESEDELGDLWRSFEGMALALRSTLARVAQAADRVEATAGSVDQVAEDVGAVTASQVEGIRQATRAVDALNGQVRGIADASQALSESVEETSSAILELGTAGDELNETSGVLSARVSEVSASIQQMAQSVSQVSANTEELAQAAEETSSSMEEMAASMREVDESAEEAASLSHQVVARAESGRSKVRETIDGMDAIRDSTETAERVIQVLGDRIVEIGAIVDVIDDVADETNLLALNAAIIAAQAGDHGRAFSVVADEIKDLADRVLASTKEIDALIRAVQDESTNAKSAIERGVSSVVSGVELSAEAGLSLEEITRTSRSSGLRIEGIVTSVREQAKATGHVIALMDRVRRGVDEIRAAAGEQDRGNEVVYRGSEAMREVALQLRSTTQDQSRGSSRMREGVEEVRETVERINASLQEQSTACRSAVDFLEGVSERTQSNEGSMRRLDEVTKALLKDAAVLREDVRRFQI
jgi:methyl-accepting chemotaxis protein